MFHDRHIAANIINSVRCKVSLKIRIAVIVTMQNGISLRQQTGDWINYAGRFGSVNDLKSRHRIVTR